MLKVAAFYDVAEMVGAGKKVWLSAKHFSDEQVKLVTAVGMLQTQRTEQKR
ncbi:MAG: hypothetical protein K2W95_32650 [Candidatus Obscuribacterales bacterium]|nr:hypothetical protein [Candidatus Obscuribacterales bacterium]